MSNPTPFGLLNVADLRVDQTYEGGSAKDVGADPISRLLPVGNLGGFRFKGSVVNDNIRLIVLYTSGSHPDWPDSIDPYTGSVVYYGDNRSPGQDLHGTARQGNLILQRIFERASGDLSARSKVPPIFVFSKGEHGRDVVFKGLAVPGSPSTPAQDNLVAVWRVIKDHRFQNYRATFTILDEAVVSREWINSILHHDFPLAETCPKSWRDWVVRSVINPLISERISIRTKGEQLPDTEVGRQILNEIHQYFNVVLGDPSQFEACATELWKLVAPSTGNVDLTQRWRDGGRDAIGTYLLGPISDRLSVEFALEAKCYAETNSVGVGDMSRLISRLRFRQFGVFVTTSYFGAQTYTEVRQDQHPVVLLCGNDIVQILATAGLTTRASVSGWLSDRFPSRK